MKTEVITHIKHLGTQTEFEAETELAPPKMYQVRMLHDDFTPPDFLKKILEDLFNMEEARAQQVMIEIRTIGEAICGVYTREIAEMKVSQVLSRAHQADHPLQCLFEVAR